MQFIPIKTRPLLPPKDNLFEVLDTYVTDVQDWDIIFITSKILAIHQGKCIKATEINKKDLVEQEADKRIHTDVMPGKDTYLTIKNDILIPSAGIDESNANGYYILWPDNLPTFSKEIHDYICKKHQVKNIGIIITDSTTRPLKWWVVGIWIYAYGIQPLIDKRGVKDIFGKALEITQVNVVDALSAMAVYLMGEAAECQPIVIGRNIPWIEYADTYTFEATKIPPENDLYRPLLKPLME